MSCQAIDSHQDERIKIQKALASIPRKLHEVRRLTKVHVRLPELHRCADRLFMAIFVVLERIIDKVSDNMRWRDKLRFRKDNDGGEDIRDAIEIMEERVEEFRDEVSVCLQVKMGRIGDDVLAIRESLGVVMRKFDGKLHRCVLFGVFGVWAKGEQRAKIGYCAQLSKRKRSFIQSFLTLYISLTLSIPS